MKNPNKAFIYLVNNSNFMNHMLDFLMKTGFKDSEFKSDIESFKHRLIATNARIDQLKGLTNSISGSHLPATAKQSVMDRFFGEGVQIYSSPNIEWQDLPEKAREEIQETLKQSDVMKVDAQLVNLATQEKLGEEFSKFHDMALKIDNGRQEQLQQQFDGVKGY